MQGWYETATWKGLGYDGERQEETENWRVEDGEVKYDTRTLRGGGDTGTWGEVG